MGDWLLITLALFALVIFTAPHQLTASLYKLILLTLSAVAGYWIDRSLFPYARPDCFLDMNGAEPDAPAPLPPEIDAVNTCTLECTPDGPLLHLMGIAMLRRAIIVAAAMLAMGLGA